MRWSSFAAAAVSALALPPGTASASPRQIHIANGGVPVLSGLQTTPSPRISVLEKVPTISVSATEANALSAITLKDGELAWRLLLPSDEPIIQFVTDVKTDTLVLLSGHGGATVRKISLTHGRVLWESRQHDHHAGFLPDQGFTGADVTFVGASEGTESDVVVLTNAREVRRLDGRTGETVWKTSAATAQTSTRARIVDVDPKTQHLRVLSLSEGLSGSPLKASIEFLDYSSGSFLGSSEASKHSFASVGDVVVLARQGVSSVGWVTPDGQVVSGLVPTEPRGAFKTLPAKDVPGGIHALVDVDVAKSGYALARSSNGQARALEVKPDGSLENVWLYNEEEPSALYSGFVDKHGMVHVAKISFSPYLRLASLGIATMPNKEHPEGIMTGETLPFDADTNGDMISAVVEVSERKDYYAIARMMVQSTGGSLSLWYNGKMRWERHEDLSQVKAVVRASEGGTRAQGGFWSALKQAWQKDSFDVADVLEAFNSIHAHPSLEGESGISYYVGTATGRVHAIGRRPPSSEESAADEGKTKSADDDEEGEKKQKDIVWTSHLVPSDTRDKVEWTSLREWKNGSLTAVLSTSRATYVTVLKASNGEVEYRTERERKITPPSHEVALANRFITKHDGDVGASPARVKGNRDTLTKYLDRDLVVELSCSAASSSSTPTLTAELKNPVRGDTIHLVSLGPCAAPSIPAGPAPPVPRAGSKQVRMEEVQVGLTDNWLTLAVPDPREGVKGTVISSTEVYVRNGTTGKDAPLSSGNSYAVTKSFFVPNVVFRQTTHARSRLGVAPRSLLAITDSDQIVMVPRRALDPRRPAVPAGKKMDKYDAEEGLAQYAPMVELDVQSVVTGSNEVLGLDHLATFPTSFESTSSLFSSGRLDVFASAIHPSRAAFDMLGQTFNKGQLVVVLAGLGLGVAVLRPMVRRMKVKREWYS